jgi:hypothetical protein
MAGSCTIYDCGSGVGLLASLLEREGCKVTALDLIQRAVELFPIQLKDARTYPFKRDSVVVIARPCHSTWVVDTIKQACKREVREIVYIGLPKNVKDDLDDLRHLFKKEVSKVGEDGESLWRFQYKEQYGISELHTFCLVKQNGDKYPSWWEDCGIRWENSVGGYQYKNKSERILKTCQAMDFSDLDWRNTALIHKESVTGWLSPTGEWLGCSTYNHQIVATLQIGSPHPEDLGWCKVYGKNLPDGFDFYCSSPLTSIQRDWLLSHGYAFNRVYEDTLSLQEPQPVLRKVEKTGD